MRRRALGACVFGLLAIQTLLLSYSAKVHSPTWDEVGHLAAGISHWELGRFELYSVNPPLVRTIAAAPVALVSRPEMDWSFYRSDPALRSEIVVGRRMVEMNGADSFRHFFYARLAVIPIALLGGWLCFLWARDLFGDVSGLIALALWTFSPNVLAYGAIITPDMGAIVAFLGSTYVFWRWLRQPHWSWTMAFGVVLGVAMLTKSVWLFLPFAFAVVWFIHLLFSRRASPRVQDESPHSRQGTSWLRSPACVQSFRLGLAFLFALVLTNGFYGFTGTMSSLGSFAFVSSSLSGNAPVRTASSPECVECENRDRFEAQPGNRFEKSWLAHLPIPLPANYLQGIDVQTLDFERGFYDPGWKSYLLGKWQQGGWWYFYAVGLFVKVPLAVWLLIGVGSLTALSWRPDRNSMQGVICLWGPAIIFFVVISTVGTGLNRHVRYALPLLPVLFIWASQFGRYVTRESVGGGVFRRGVVGATAAMLIWLAGVSITNAPHHLSYFNETVGGPAHGHEYLCDSNIDWGQDLTLLRLWLDKNPEAEESLSLAYFGSLDPASVGIRYRLPPAVGYSHDSNPAVQSLLSGSGKVSLAPGWYVISKNYLVRHPMPVPNGRNHLQFKFIGGEAFSYFALMTPVDRIGQSMLVYHVPERRDAVRLVSSPIAVTRNSPSD